MAWRKRLKTKQLVLHCVNYSKRTHWNEHHDGATQVVNYHIAYTHYSYSTPLPPPLSSLSPLALPLQGKEKANDKAKNDENQNSSTVSLTAQASFFWAVGFLLPLTRTANGTEAFTAKIPIEERQQENNTPEKHAKRPNGLRYSPHFVLHLRRHIKQAIYGHSHGRGQGEHTVKEPSWEHYADAERVTGPTEWVPDPSVQRQDTCWWGCCKRSD